MPPAFPVLYWRSVESRVSDFSLDSLLVSRPEQCIVFDSELKQLEHVLQSGDDPVTNEPGLNPNGTLVVNKQQGRSYIPTLTLEGNCNVSETIWRDQVRIASRRSQIEFEHHKYGIIGFHHPNTHRYEFGTNPRYRIHYGCSCV